MRRRILQAEMWFRRWMVGRRGPDELMYALFAAGFVLLFASLMFRFPPLAILAWALVLGAYFRFFSKSLDKRWRENQRFLALGRRMQQYGAFCSHRWRNRKAYRYYKCPQCHQRLRVPKGRGNLEITCPRCHTQFHKHT